MYRCIMSPVFTTSAPGSGATSTQPLLPPSPPPPPSADSLKGNARSSTSAVDDDDDVRPRQRGKKSYCTRVVLSGQGERIVFTQAAE